MHRAALYTVLFALLLAGAGCDQDGGNSWPDPDTGVDTTLDTVDDTGVDSAPDTAPDSEPDTATDPVEEDPTTTTLDPPAGESSGGSGGGAASGSVQVTAVGGVTYRIIAPGGAGPHPLMIVYSGTEGGVMMTTNIQSVSGAFPSLRNIIYAILDGVDYYGDGMAGAHVLDHVRGLYDIDNDRTYLLSESAGTRAGLSLGLDLRQSYFAAYWANDVNASGTPRLTAAELGFAPYGNAGPGGDWPDANIIVNGMVAAGYRCPEPAPYDGPGSDTHGHPDQFVAAMQWFPGKTRL